MKKFFFRLDTLLRVRKLREERMHRELAYTQQKLSQWKEKEATLERQIASLVDEIRLKREVGERALQETYTQILDHLQGSLDQVKGTIGLQQRQVEERRQRLQRVMQDRKVIEKVKDKHYSDWQTQAEKENELTHHTL